MVCRDDVQLTGAAAGGTGERTLEYAASELETVETQSAPPSPVHDMPGFWDDPMLCPRGEEEEEEDDDFEYFDDDEEDDDELDEEDEFEEDEFDDEEEEEDDDDDEDF